MACYHATPLLTFGDDAPPWDYRTMDSPQDAALALLGGESVHAADRAEAAAILGALNVVEREVERLLTYAETAVLI